MDAIYGPTRARREALETIARLRNALPNIHYVLSFSAEYIVPTERNEGPLRHQPMLIGWGSGLPIQ